MKRIIALGPQGETIAIRHFLWSFQCIPKLSIYDDWLPSYSNTPQNGSVLAEEFEHHYIQICELMDFSLWRFIHILLQTRILRKQNNVTLSK